MWYVYVMKHKNFAIYSILILLVILLVILGIGIYYQQNAPVENNMEINEPFVLPTAPGPDASPEDTEVFVEAIRKHAVSANIVEVKESCALSPAIIRIKEGDGLTFKNLDALQHTIVIIEQYTIPAGGAHALSATFEKGPGIYGIGCDAVGTKGFLEVYEEDENL